LAWRKAVDVIHQVCIWLLALCAVSVCLSWFFYLPIFLRKLRASNPQDFRHLGGMLWIPSLRAPEMVAYLLKRQYLQCDDKSLRRHGAILRWTFAIACVTSVVLGAMFFLLETLER
jgi:hypothetical protein